VKVDMWRGAFQRWLWSYGWGLSCGGPAGI
jgi:hypothetical protein